MPHARAATSLTPCSNAAHACSNATHSVQQRRAGVQQRHSPRAATPHTRAATLHAPRARTSPLTSGGGAVYLGITRPRILGFSALAAVGGADVLDSTSDPYRC